MEVAVAAAGHAIWEMLGRKCLQGVFTSDRLPASVYSVLAAESQSLRLNLYVKTGVTRVHELDNSYEYKNLKKISPSA